MAASASGVDSQTRSWSADAELDRHAYPCGDVGEVAPRPVRRDLGFVGRARRRQAAGQHLGRIEVGGLPQQIPQPGRARRDGGLADDGLGLGAVAQAGARQLDAEHVGARSSTAIRSAELAPRGVADQEKACAAGTVGEDLVHRAERERRRACRRRPSRRGIAPTRHNPGRSSAIAVKPCAAAERSNDSCGWPGQSKYADDVAPPWTATITARGSCACGDERRHRHAVDQDDAWAWGGVASAHASVRRSITPLGVRPPLLATRDAGARDLAFARLAAQLVDRLVDQAHAVGAAVRQLTAVGVQRDHAVAGDGLAAVEEVLGLADAAEPEPLQPRQAVEREAVVELGDVDIAWAATMFATTCARTGRAPGARGSAWSGPSRCVR